MYVCVRTMFPSMSFYGSLKGFNEYNVPDDVLVLALQTCPMGGGFFCWLRWVDLILQMPGHPLFTMA